MPNSYALVAWIQHIDLECVFLIMLPNTISLLSQNVITLKVLRFLRNSILGFFEAFRMPCGRASADNIQGNIRTRKVGQMFFGIIPSPVV